MSLYLSVTVINFVMNHAGGSFDVYERTLHIRCEWAYISLVTMALAQNILLRCFWLCVGCSKWWMVFCLDGRSAAKAVVR